MNASIRQSFGLTRMPTMRDRCGEAKANADGGSVHDSGYDYCGSKSFSAITTLGHIEEDGGCEFTALAACTRSCVEPKRKA